MRIEFEDNFDEFDVIENVYVPATEEVSEYSEHEPDYLSDYYVNLLGQHMVEWDTLPGMVRMFGQAATVCQTIEVENRDYDPKTRTFAFECSDKDINHPGRDVILKNPKTGRELRFKFVKADTDGEDVWGWNYESVIGAYKLLIIND